MASSVRGGSHRIKFETNVPNYVTSTWKQLTGYLWDPTCPFGSLYAWLMAFISLYYLIGLPNARVYLDKDESRIRAEKVTRSLRWWLFSSSVIMAVIGYYMIHKGCAGAGSKWAALWFISAMILARLVSAVIMSSIENVVACKLPAGF